MYFEVSGLEIGTRAPTRGYVCNFETRHGYTKRCPDRRMARANHTCHQQEAASKTPVRRSQHIAGLSADTNSRGVCVCVCICGNPLSNHSLMQFPASQVTHNTV